MSRSVRSSVAESVHSMMDSMGDDEFLSASPFNPKNLELRRVQREAIVNRTTFQPEFCRIDSMAYCGRGIVEDNDHVAPVASPARARPLPSKGAVATTAAPNRKPAMNASEERPPASTHILVDDVVNGSSPTHAVPSASRRRSSLLRDQFRNTPTPTPTRGGTASAPPQMSATLHIPAPPPPTAAASPITPDRNGTGRRRMSTGGVGGGDAAHTNGARGSQVAAPPPAAFTTPAPYASMTKVLLVAPLSPAGTPTNSFASPPAAAVVVAEQSQRQPQRPPRAPLASASPTRLDLGGGRQRTSQHRPAPAPGPHATLHGDRRKKVDCVEFTAPLSPAKRPSLSDPIPFPSPVPRGITTTTAAAAAPPSSSSQSSVPTLPALSLQGGSSSEETGTALAVVQRRNSSPARVRRGSATALGAFAALDAAGPRSSSGSNNSDRGTRAKACDSSGSTPQTLPMSPSSASRSSDTTGTPSERHRYGRPVLQLGKANFTLHSTAITMSTASQPSAAPSVVSRTSSTCTSPHTTPVATPSATLRLMTAQRSPAGRLVGAARVTVAPSPTATTGLGLLPTPPASAPPPVVAVKPQRCTARLTPAPEALDRSPATDHRTTARAAASPLMHRHPPPPQKPALQHRGVPTNVTAANDAFLSQAKTAQRRRSLLDAGGSTMCDSVRRQYYCLPSAEETSMPSFARCAGDLYGQSSENDEVESPVWLAAPAPSSPPPARLSLGAGGASSSSPASVREKMSSAVRRDYFLDTASPTTRETSETPAWSPDADRFILPDLSDAESNTEGSAAPMQPLMLDAVRAFNDRFKKYQTK